ncbi:MAG TPA: LamG-like jellyroll fold domain-containing protein [Solirubrobacteraceae bacterium]|nr:LamG-like jellyroll fold domain-containing protein [Solirubrobacteraceae bacterium]
MRRLAGCVVFAVLLFVGAAGGSPPPGITSWWPGEGDGTDVVSAHNGTLDGTVGFTTAVVGQGFVFDGVEDLVRVDDNADFTPGTDSFTVDAWVKTTNGTDALIIRHYECAGFCTDADSSSNWDLRLVNHHAWGFIRDVDKGGPVDQGEGQTVEGTSVVDDGVFHHVAFVRDQAAGHARLYVDGTLQADVPLNDGSSGALSNIDGDADPVTIGGGWLGGTMSPDSNISFPGVIDEVQWYRNTALTGDQIAAICTSAVTVTSAATAPATGTVGQPLVVSYGASDNIGVARVNLLVRTPGASGFTQVATNTTGSGSFSYTPTEAGDYGFATTAEDASCGREAAPAEPDAITRVAAVTTPPPTTTTPPAAKPQTVPITQIASLPSPKRCVSRRHFRIHLRNHGLHPLNATVFLNGKRVKVIKGAHLAADIDLRGLPKGKVKVRLTISYREGKTLTGSRTYHTCTARKHKATHHKV